MRLYLGVVCWYDNDDNEKLDTVIGFAENLSQFAEHISGDFPDISNVTIKCINFLATENQLLYIPESVVDMIVKENDY